MGKIKVIEYTGRDRFMTPIYVFLLEYVCSCGKPVDILRVSKTAFDQTRGRSYKYPQSNPWLQPGEGIGGVKMLSSVCKDCQAK